MFRLNTSPNPEQKGTKEPDKAETNRTLFPTLKNWNKKEHFYRC
jgi:hypothetical protein